MDEGLINLINKGKIDKNSIDFSNAFFGTNGAGSLKPAKYVF